MSLPTAEQPAPRGTLAGRLRAWADAGRWRTHDLLLHGGGLSDGERCWPGFAAWCEAHAGSRCRVWLASALLHELVCDPTLPLADDAAVLAWARPLLQHYHGDPALAWPLAAWAQGRRRGVSVLHGVPLGGLLAAAAASRVRLLSLRPWWSLCLAQALQRHPALRGPQALLLLVEGPRLAVLGLAQGQLARLELRRLSGNGADALAPWLDGANGPTLVLTLDMSGAVRPAAAGAPTRWLAGAPAAAGGAVA